MLCVSEDLQCMVGNATQMYVGKSRDGLVTKKRFNAGFAFQSDAGSWKPTCTQWDDVVSIML